MQGESVLVVVDGYNLLKRICASLRISLDEREQVLQRIEQRAHGRGYTVCVVFDGGQSPLCTRYVVRTMTVVEVGYGRSADLYIEELAGRLSSEMVVITADRALAQAVKRSGVVTVDPSEYWSIILHAPVSGPVAVSGVFVCMQDASECDTIYDVQQLLAYDGFAELGPKEGDGDEESVVRGGSGYRLKRRERARRVLIERL